MKTPQKKAARILCGLKTQPKERELEEMTKFKLEREVQGRHSYTSQILEGSWAKGEVTGRGITAQRKLKLEMLPHQKNGKRMLYDRILISHSI